MTNLYLKVYPAEPEGMLIDGTETYTAIANIDDFFDDLKKIIGNKKVIIHSDKDDTEPDEFICISNSEIIDVINFIDKEIMELIAKTKNKIDISNKKERYELYFKIKNLTDALFLIKTKEDNLLTNDRAILQIEG